MFKTLIGKLTLAFFTLILLLSALFVGLMLITTDWYQKEVMQKLNHDLAAHIVKNRILMEGGQINREALTEVFDMMMVINPSIELYLLDTEGAILAYSAKPGQVKRRAVDLQPLRRAIASEGSRSPQGPLLGDDPRDFHKRKIFSAATIRHKGRLTGYLYIILAGQIYDSAVQQIKSSYIIQLSTWLLVGGLLLTAVAGLLLLWMITARLRRLTATVRDFSRTGELVVTEPAATGESRDELDVLSQTFHHMASRIQAQVEELKQVDRLRRELVANVSHDLRTPLATLQGYIETLQLKHDQLDAGQRREYLTIAISHCERLNKLVAELFELAKLDSKDIRLQLEPFCLPELVHDVIQKFQLIAEEKSIDIAVDMPESGTFVKADIGMIERVLENLIENALRHTPEGGRIHVRLQPKAEDMEVSIADTGVGIPAEELPYIFDRFYQVEKSRQGKQHAGLGLAIARRIIELHNRTIVALSSPRQGTAFVFQLPGSV